MVAEADRAGTACRALQERENLDLVRLDLVEPRHMLPAPWNALVTALERTGSMHPKREEMRNRDEISPRRAAPA